MEKGKKNTEFIIRIFFSKPSLWSSKGSDILYDLILQRKHLAQQALMTGEMLVNRQNAANYSQNLFSEHE